MVRSTRAYDVETKHGRTAVNLLDYLRPVDVVGIPKIRMGSVYDGGYVCLEPTPGALLLSYGLGGNVDFEREFAARVPGGRVVGFDPVPCALALPENVTVVQEALGAVRAFGPGGVDTLAGHLERFGGASSSDVVVKIDIEGGEWSAFEATPDAELRRFTQLIVEWHGLSHVATHMRARTLWARLATHFSLYHVHGNNYRGLVEIDGLLVPETLECSYVRHGVVATTSPSREPFPGPLDRPNDRKAVDHPLPFVRQGAGRGGAPKAS